MIPRCPHDIYSPDGDGRPSEYCSGCCTTLPLLTARFTTTDAIFEDNTLQGGAFVYSNGFINYKSSTPISAEFFGDEDEEEEEPAECPACFAPMKIEDEYDLECVACGFNDL